jgi:hypothetical protein
MLSAFLTLFFPSTVRLSSTANTQIAAILITAIIHRRDRHTEITSSCEGLSET